MRMSTDILKSTHVKKFNFASKTSLQDFPARARWEQIVPQKARRKDWSRAGFGCLAGRGKGMKVLQTGVRQQQQQHLAPDDSPV